MTHRNAAQDASDEAKFEQTKSVRCHAAGVKAAARTLLAEPRSTGNEETWATLVAKSSAEDHTAVATAATAAVLTSATEVEDGNSPPWRTDDEYASEVLFDVISSRSSLSGLRNDGQPFAHLPSISTQKSGGRSLAGHNSLLTKNGGRTGRVHTGVLTVPLAVEPHCVAGKLSIELRGHDVGEVHHPKSYAVVTAAAVGGQSRGEAVWSRRARRSGYVGLRARTLHEVRNHRLFQRLRHCEKDCSACVSGQLRARTHAVGRLKLWHKTGCRFFSRTPGRP